MFRVGPDPETPIPKGSIILCYYCEEFIGRAKRRIWVTDNNTYWMSMYYVDYAIEPEWADICTSCGQDFVNGERRTKYVIDSLLGRVMLFLANAPVI